VAKSREEARALATRLLAAYVFIANGSGVVISPDGLVLTNHHVIEGEGADLDIRFAGGAVLKAKLLGSDPVGDIAVLKAEPKKPLPYVDLAPAEALIAGIPVLAVGDPFGLGDFDTTPSLSQGVLSCARIVREDYTDALQLDAPVNPGNSGGPLFDRAGRLLGINGQIRTLSGMRINSGVGLAIASTQLAAFLPHLRAAKGRYVHHTAKPKDLGLEQRPDGVHVADAGGLALAVGVRVVAIAGRPVTSLPNAIGLFESLPWSATAVIPITVAATDGTVRDVAIPAGRKTIPGRPYHGLVVIQRGELVAVESVDDKSPAAEAGIGKDDILLSANGRPVTRKLDLLKAMVKLEIGDALTLKLKGADGKEREVVVPLVQRD